MNKSYMLTLIWLLYLLDQCQPSNSCKNTRPTKKTLTKVTQLNISEFINCSQGTYNEFESLNNKICLITSCVTLNVILLSRQRLHSQSNHEKEEP